MQHRFALILYTYKLSTGIFSENIGNRLVEILNFHKQFSLVAATRQKDAVLPNRVKKVNVGDLASDSSLGYALEGIDVIVHTAARVHIMHDNAIDPLSEFRKVNVEGTLNLAKQAAASGVKRFIFISSI